MFPLSALWLPAPFGAVRGFDRRKRALIRRWPLLCAVLLLGGPAAHAPALAQEQALGDRIDRLFTRFGSDTPGAAIAVVRDGETLYTQGYGMADLEHAIPVTPTTIFDVASVSKQFAGMAIAMLVEQGDIDLDAQIQRYIPEVPDFGTAITMRHLVHHTSGIRDWPHTLVLGGWRFDDVIAFDQILRMVWNQRELNFEPGSEYTYSNTNYNLLAETVARVTGRSFRAWTDENILEPLGMSSSHFQDDHTEIVPGRAYGYERGESRYRTVFNGLTALGSSSLFSTAEDMARWLVNYNTRQVGGRAVYDRMRTRGFLNNGEEIAYAYGISRGSWRDRQTWTHSGGWAGFRSYLLHLPEERLGVVILSNAGDYNPGPPAYRIAQIVLGDEDAGNAAETVGTPPASIPVEVSQSLQEEYAGTYRLGPGWYLEVRVEDGGLVAQATGEPTFPMLPRSRTEFLVLAYGAAIHFVRDATDRVSGIDYRGIEAPRIELAPDPPRLSDYVGTYYSDELDTQYRIEMVEGKLLARHQRHGAFALRHAWQDEFTSGAWYFRPVTFIRDASGRVEQLLVGSGRVRNVRFRRIDDPRH
jgi:CubicO group peptidase (beta-lactamase class C family)